MQNAKAHGVTFVAATGVVTYEGRTCRLRASQLDILEHLLDAHPRPVSAAHLFALLYVDRAEADTPETNVLKKHISTMRSAFRDAGVAIDIQATRGRIGGFCGYGLVLGSAGEEQSKVA